MAACFRLILTLNSFQSILKTYF